MHLTKVNRFILIALASTAPVDRRPGVEAGLRLERGRIVDGHVLAEDSARQANLKGACRGLHPPWDTTVPMAAR